MELVSFYPPPAIRNTVEGAKQEKSIMFLSEGLKTNLDFNMWKKAPYQNKCIWEQYLVAAIFF